MASMRGWGSCRLLLNLLLVALLTAAGCGKPTGTISGKVYFKDKPLSSGIVTFLTTTDAYRGFIKDDGSYTVSKVPVGDVTIIVTVNPQPNPAAKSASQSKPVTIPEKYGDPKTSGQKHTVTAGDQQKDIKLD
ncbi:MAG TPA: hypothetical protein VKE94_02675 [Gemmataceae bacterium]|nr:hypothetical protein [Gemmataceae bacterium]